jgi:hypothetical protein
MSRIRRNWIVVGTTIAVSALVAVILARAGESADLGCPAEHRIRTTYELTGQGHPSEVEALTAMTLNDPELRGDVPTAPTVVNDDGSERTVHVRDEEAGSVWITYVDSEPTIESVVAALGNGEYAVDHWIACA